MPLHPTHRKRTPYLFHFEGQTVALGEPGFLRKINDRLIEAGYSTRPTYWDQAYLEELSSRLPEQGRAGADLFDDPSDPEQLNSVGVICSSSEFWSAMYARSFQQAGQEQPGETLYMPPLPSWLEGARAWVLDPIAPQDGPDAPDPLGGWVRTRGPEGSGQPVGIFQLGSPTSIWVFGSSEDLVQVLALIRDLARDLTGFDRATAFLGYDLLPSSIRLPVDCAQALQEHLFLAGVDTEVLLWNAED